MKRAVKALVWACGVLGFSTAWAVGSADELQPPATAASAPAPSKGLHIVLDASGSMCGYLRPNDPDSPLLEIIRYASALQDAEKGNRLRLIRQQGARPNAADLGDAPKNLQALLTAPGARSCGPFNGVDSNMDLVFGSREGKGLARSLVLVSDMQLDEDAQTSFADRFRVWLREQSPDASVSAGIVTLSARFSGKYFPISDKASKGYQLGEHVRPLNVLWFAVGKEDAASVRELLRVLAALQAAPSQKVMHGLQVYPVLTSDASRWLVPVQPLTAARQLLRDPSFVVVAPNSDRGPRDLQECPQVKWNGNALLVDVRRKCRDGKPFFDAVQQIRVTLPIETSWGVSVEADGRPMPQALMIPIGKRGPAAAAIPLRLTVAGTVPNGEKLLDLSLDNDACDEKDLKACLVRLERKVYLYERLVKKFASRANMVSNERVAKELSLPIEFKR